MTTYILHGGKTSDTSSKNDPFFSEFTSNVEKGEVNILMCYWSRPKQNWHELFQRDSTKVIKQSSKITNFHIVENPSDLFNQLPSFDVLYVAGGDAEPIEKYYSNLTNLKNALENKVYIGSSMGAFLASTSYVLSLSDQNEHEVHQEVGLLPFNCLCHWDTEVDKNQKLKLFQSQAPQLPTLTLNEQQYIKIYL
jgi:peptidase E